MFWSVPGDVAIFGIVVISFFVVDLAAKRGQRIIKLF